MTEEVYHYLEQYGFQNNLKEWSMGFIALMVILQIGCIYLLREGYKKEKCIVT